MESSQFNQETKENRTKKKKSIGKKILSWIGWFFLAFLLVFILIKTIDRFTGYTWSILPVRSCVISSGSMSVVDESNKKRLEGYNDQLQKGDYIYYKPYKSYDEIQENDVVVYYNGSTLITHRVVQKSVQNGVNYIITQGDANNSNDGLIPYSWMRGKVVGKIPYIGYVTLYLISPYGLLAISSVVLIVVIWALVNELLKKKEKEKLELKEKIEKTNEELIIELIEEKKGKHDHFISFSPTILLEEYEKLVTPNESSEENKKNEVELKSE